MKYNVSIETLCPLHISSGVELLREFDFDCRDSYTYVLNQNAIYQYELKTHGAKARLNEPAARLLRPEQLAPDSPFVSYTLSNGTTLATIQEQIKDPDGCCYLPGSSLKGALRTAIMAFVACRNPERLDVADLNPFARKEEAAKPWERDLFGENPSKSIFRALQVFDSRPLPRERLQLCQVSLCVEDEVEVPIAVEAVQRGTVFSTSIHIDELALAYAGKLGWKEKALWLADLVRIIQEVSEQRIEIELKWARKNGFVEIAGFYEELGRLAEKLKGSRAFLLQIGWGSGWNGTTVGPFLSEEQQKQVREMYRLGTPPKAGKDWQPDLAQPFPKTRCYSVKGERHPQPTTPLGWATVLLESAEAASEQWKELQREARKQLRPFAGKRASHPAPVIRTRVTLFTAAPEPGQRFFGTVDDIVKDQAYLSIPILSDEEWVGVAKLPEKGLGIDEKVLCEVVSVQRDPHNPEGWLVRCEIVR